DLYCLCLALRVSFYYTLSLLDALPIWELADAPPAVPGRLKRSLLGFYFRWASIDGMVNPFGLEVLRNPDLLPFERPFVAAHEWRSEEHTSELQSRENLVCRLLPEKKNK